MVIVNYTARLSGAGNGPFNGLPATLSNPVKILGGYSFVYTETNGFTGTVKLVGTFTIGPGQQPVGGQITKITFVTPNGTSVFSGFSIPTATIASNLTLQNNDVFYPAAFAGADRITGSQYNDHLWGYSGNDTLLGGNGNDWLFGGDGNDLLNGGAGIDGVSYSTASAGVTVSLQIKSVAQNTGSNGIDTLVSIEKLEGSMFSDVLTGSTGADSLWGLDGNDTLNGGSGNDWLYGGKGADLLFGGAGVDGVSYYYAEGAVRVSLGLQGQSQNTLGDGLDTLHDFEKLAGSQFGDTLTGSAAADSIWGWEGDDSIVGGSGDDFLSGGTGNDRLFGGAGTDFVSYYDAAAGVTVSLNLQNTNQNTGSEGVDFLSGFENIEGSDYADTLTGSVSNNVIYGELGNDIINGLAGDDWLIGGIGADTMTGGAGHDDFIYFNGWKAGSDRILDFNFNEDQVGFQNSMFSTFASVLSATTDTAAGARISWLGGGVLLVGVDKGELSHDNFHFFA